MLQFLLLSPFFPSPPSRLSSLCRSVSPSFPPASSGTNHLSTLSFDFLTLTIDSASVRAPRRAFPALINSKRMFGGEQVIEIKRISLYALRSLWARVFSGAAGAFCADGNGRRLDTERMLENFGRYLFSLVSVDSWVADSVEGV